MGVSPDLIEYLCNLIGTPDQPGTFWENLSDDVLAAHDDNSIIGLVVQGTPTEDQAFEIMRVLKPGAYLLLMSLDKDPTGHTGACRVEDAGMEIRDAILVQEEATRFHYVPKTSRAEREAGCGQLPAKTGAESVERKEDSAGVKNPRAGAGRTAKAVHNWHPTVKPIALMERLLEGVPKEQGSVCDPFLGSGTTAIACLATGHDCIGIERDEDYFKIADARVRHHDSASHGWQTVDLDSDVAPAERKMGYDLNTLFFGEDE